MPRNKTRVEASGSNRPVPDLQSDMAARMADAKEEHARLQAQLAALAIQVKESTGDSRGTLEAKTQAETHQNDACAITANAMTSHAVHSSRSHAVDHADSKPSGKCAGSTYEGKSKSHCAEAAHSAMGRAIQGTASKMDHALVTPPTPEPPLSPIQPPAQKLQDDPIAKLAITQVMQEHGLSKIPTEAAYRSMFMALVQDKKQKLIRCRSNRVKRREHRQMKHTETYGDTWLA